MRLILLFLAATSHALEQPRGKATAKTIRTTKADVEAVAITQALQNIKLKVTGGATTGLAHRLEVGAFFGGWYALNIYYNIINKKVLKTVGLPWLVSWAQLVVGALYALVGWGIGRTGQPAVRDAWPVAVAHCGQQVTTVISLGAGAVTRANVAEAVVAGCRRKLLLERQEELEALRRGFTFDSRMDLAMQLARSWVHIACPPSRATSRACPKIT